MSGYRRRDRLGVSPRQTIERALNLKGAAVILQDLGESADLAASASLAESDDGRRTISSSAAACGSAGSSGTGVGGVHGTGHYTPERSWYTTTLKLCALNLL
jgi:hypothetical protein